VGRRDRLERVRVYSNCARVELFLNGRSQGRRRRDPSAFPAAGLVWEVNFQEGPNRLRAVGAMGAGEVEHEIVQDFRLGPAGPAAGMVSSVELGRTPDGQECLKVSVQLVDPAGLPAVEERRRLRFAVEGGGGLWSEQGTADGSSVVEAANGRGVAQVLGGHAGALVVRTDGLDEVRIPLP
jgi:beta-galactosidase